MLRPPSSSLSLSLSLKEERRQRGVVVTRGRVLCVILGERHSRRDSDSFVLEIWPHVL